MMQRLRLLLVGLLLSVVASWLYSQQRERQRTMDMPVPTPSYPLKRDTVPAPPAAPVKAETPQDTTTHIDNSNNNPAPAHDPLIDIDGIGPVFAKALNVIGIHTFAELAAENADVLADKLPASITADRIRRDRWIEQAQERLQNPR